MGQAALIIGVIGSVISGLAQYQSLQYQAAIAEMNQKIALDNAARAIERSQIEQQTQDDISAAFLGEQLAAQSASGLSLGSSSFFKTRKAGARLGRLDAANIRQAGQLEAHAYRTDAFNFAAQAAGAKASATNSILGMFVDVATNFVGGSKSSPKTAGKLGILGAVKA